MKKVRKPKGYWTYEHCKEEALKYNNRSDFQDNCIHAYNITRKNGWLEDIWTDIELKILIENYANNKQYCFEKINRAIESNRNKASQLKISKPKPHKK